jgi:CheY-like chemotaxis protein
MFPISNAPDKPAINGPTNSPALIKQIDVKPKSLIATIGKFSAGNGILHLGTIHHSWNLLIQQNSIALIEEEGEMIPTLLRKLKAQKVKVSQLTNLEKYSNLGCHSDRISDQEERLKMYSLFSQVFTQEREFTRQAFKEVLLENLLAIHLEPKFSLVWQPLNNHVPLDLPIWPLKSLEESLTRTLPYWQKLTHIEHPYQKVQLMRQDDTLAQVPLFMQVTTGQHRICEISDKFKQPLARTALHLDRLAAKGTVSILPLLVRRLETPRVDVPSESPPKVVVVDDSPVLLKQFGNLLNRWGYEVILLDNAEKATQEILNYNPNVAFLDINMPGLNGFELIKKIRRQPTLAAIPLVLVTAENNLTNSFRAKWANCRFLAKPRSHDDTQEFRQQLRALLREVAPLPTDKLV